MKKTEKIFDTKNKNNNNNYTDIVSWSHEF